jgi:hypothetical protein
MFGLPNLCMFLFATAFCSASWAVVPQSCEQELTHEEPFRWIAPNESLSEFMFPSGVMAALFGNPPRRPNSPLSARKLFERHKNLIPQGYAIMEAGSYRAPLKGVLETGPWVVWDFNEDDAIRKANAYRRSVVFVVDFKLLNSNSWMDFIQANRNALWSNKYPIYFGAAILSSVLSTTDYGGALAAVMELLQPGGILILTHVETGPLTSYHLLEFMFKNFGERIEVLEGSGLLFLNQSDKPALELAVKIKEPRIRSQSGQGFE